MMWRWPLSDSGTPGHRRLRRSLGQARVQGCRFGTGFFEVAERSKGKAELSVDPFEGVVVAGLVGGLHSEVVDGLPVRSHFQGLATGPVGEAVFAFVEEEVGEVFGRFGHSGLDGKK